MKRTIFMFSLILLLVICASSKTVFASDEATSTMESSNKQAFNMKFEKYMGKQVGTNIKGLLNTVLSNNVSMPEKKISVAFSDETGTATDIANIMKKIDTESNYNVRLNYSGDGFVNGIQISTIANITFDNQESNEIVNNTNSINGTSNTNSVNGTNSVNMYNTVNENVITTVNSISTTKNTTNTSSQNTAKTLPYAGINYTLIICIGVIFILGVILGIKIKKIDK